MSIANLIPGLKGSGSRRAVDKVEELRDENTRLLTYLHQAGDEIALLRWDVTVATSRQGEAEELVVQLKADADDLIDDRDVWKAEALALRARLAPFLAAEANANRVTVPPMVRDTSAFEDQATGPIDVRELRERFATGLVVSLHHSPQAASPVHVPSWAVADGPATT
ncbi:hypothetical protein [Streptomyces sp. NPDC060027]|uniref:hypothetical protein n=1 Tax=Streptomyces sp. NPDC060027 TaxID=3347040 RepID=UPI0036CBF269